MFPGMTADGLMAGAQALSYSAESYENDPNVELLWARSAFEHATMHYDLLRSVDAKLLRLTPIDEEIYKDFRDQFPRLRVDIIEEDDLKSADQKGMWREFCEKYKSRIEDYNLATLLRLRCDGDYTEENTTITPRIQFYAIEVARNKEGKNDVIKNSKLLSNDSSEAI